MDFFEKFQSHWKQYFAATVTDGARVIVAVSGGADSVVLAHCLDRLGLKLVLAHCNFHLRAESDSDQIFVESFARSIEKKIFVKDFDTLQYAQDNKLGIEEAARELRYDWFAGLAVQNLFDEHAPHAPYPIMVAHHASDNVETVLFHFFRGTGIAGLHGMQPVNGNVFRPLLFATKQEILQYAIAQDLRWMEDISNRDNRYTRNFLRLDVIPELKDHFPTIEKNILENIDRLSAVENIYKERIAEYKSTLLRQRDDGFAVNVSLLRQVPELKTIVWEIVQPCGFTAHQTDEIIKLLDAVSGKYIQSSTHTIIKDRDEIIIVPLVDKEETIIVPDSATVVAVGSYICQITEAGIADFEQGYSDPYQAVLDAGKIRFPLIFRHWKEGDSFVPLGMKNRKNISDFFIDNKVSVAAKQRSWLLESAGKICWIAGMRIDDRYKITDCTKKVITIHFKKNT